MRSRRSTLAVSVAATLLLQGCHAILAPAAVRVPGVIDFYHDGSAGVLTAPDTVQQGVDVQVTITTFGGGCERVGGAVVSRTGNTATLEVYDYTEAYRANIACPDILRRFPRSVTVRFPDAGTGTLRVIGRRLGPETDWQGVSTVLEKEIVVR